ncbi:MAG: methyltransferase domain-containing protein [Betaproteobacteria bacterium]|nr:methyltransferase domain-containing protein [Betaproteobacteria bacterium]
MKTEWDYTALADAYLKRPDYADAAIDAMLAVMTVRRGDRVCDVGAGVAHLALPLAKRGLFVDAVEPNDAMRGHGIARTQHLEGVRWHEGTGENTGQPSGAFRAVTFGSSFNVCDRPAALKESARILGHGGWFACLWNHRQLDDPVQARIEALIKGSVPDYGYGTRREDQTAVIDASGLFGPVVHLDSRVVHEQTAAECIEAWRSHATLQRQAGPAFGAVVEEIAGYVSGLPQGIVRVPYSTHVWVARRT